MTPDQLQDDRLAATPPERQDRAFGLEPTLNGDAPSTDPIIEPALKLRRSRRVHRFSTPP
jgi:hypothetical protein